MSMLTVSSTASSRSMFEIIKTLPSSTIVSPRPENEEAHGSFIPVRSAANTLRSFANGHTIIPRSPGKRRRVTFKETPSYLSFDDDDDDVLLPVTYTRAFPAQQKKRFQGCPSSPTKATTRDVNSSDLHPVLARLEKESRLCTQMVYCSTCRKPGHDYPRCGKCGVMWCSRTCRLVAGKRHICPPDL
jgi:hypothetical protein